MKNSLSFLFLLSIYLPSVDYCLSQATAIIGTGTSTNSQYNYPAPYGNWYWGAKHQILIRASEMTAAGMSPGNITALAFEVSVPAGTPLTGFTIRIKTTSATNVTSTFDNTGFVTVYGPQTYTDATGWNTHTLSTPFAWDGISNIIIQTCFNNTSYTINAQMRYTSTSYNSVVFFRQDAPGVCNQSSGTTSTNRPNIRFTYTPNGPPTAQFTANPTATCSGTVNFTDQSFFAITSWFWNFGDGVTSTAQNPVHTYTLNGVYSVTLTVTNVNGNNTLVQPNYITVSLGAGPIAASCTPQTTAYCCGFGITNFSFNNINNSSADGSEGYADFSCTVDTVTLGQWYPISISTPTPAAHNVRVWIDYNNDGSFNPSTELVFFANSSYLAAGNVFIPANATLNTPLRLRVSADFDLNPVPGPCDTLQYGQAEDYAIYVKPNTNPPAANFTADDTLTCSGVVQFTDLSLNVPNSWLWDFGDGNTAASPNPSNTYTANGTYSVSLTVSNANGSDTLVKTNYITVTLGNTPVTPSCQPATFSYCCGYGIYKVQLNTINKSSQDASEGYQDFSCTDQTTLNEGQSYTINIQTSASDPQDTKVWIDFDNDGTFNQGNELVFTALNTINPLGVINIPTGVVDTLVRMRISSDNAGANQGPCAPLIRGQAEDYGVIIDGPIGVNEVAVGSWQLAVYPNPFSESATLRITNLSEYANYELKVFDVFGKEVFPSVIRNSGGFVIRKCNLSAGIYVYKIMSENEIVATGKLIIQ